MKRLAIGILCCLLLTGCVWHKITIIKFSGGEVKVPFGSYVPIQGEDLKGTIIRQVWLTDEKGRKIPPIKDIEIKEKGQGQSTDDEITANK
ncbi:hypothetical protein LCGC14_1496290 [marine sediment metagenome]|uniref:Uncharacterized protein n=1 Tax=marine sediment metagenome TaxID=412755 RepID=A0A0F9JR96_9ZZZZ|nr:hypothetical protein [Pricia sp.]